MNRAVRFFTEQVAAEGGYVWLYSADLTQREGEGKASETTVWVQPPGTPSVGSALVRAFELTGDADCLAGAVEAARVLVRGQLHSGGWTHRIELAASDRRRHAYRVDGPADAKARNVSTLDDDSTQAALRFLMQVDRALEFKDASIHEAAQFGLEALLGAQFACGGWPQGFDETLERTRCVPRRASLPEEWSRTYPGHGQYWYKPTFNDNLMADVLSVLFEAEQIYGDTRYRDAAVRAGEFILMAQLPDPQPGWAQQYDVGLRPIWARKFEPPAVTGSEARGLLLSLLELHRRTDQERWLAPIPKALDYYRRSRRADGRLARFYELGSNRPLYFTKDYQLTYDDSDLPTHYSFVVRDWTAEVQRLYDARDEEPAQAQSRRQPNAAALIQALDDRGAWVEKGRLRFHGKADPTEAIISSETFARNILILAAEVHGAL